MVTKLMRQAIVLTSALIWSPAALADQMPCADLDQMTTGLADGPTHMVPQARGDDLQGNPVVLFAGPAGDWLLAVIVKDGVACIRSIGDKWGALPRGARPHRKPTVTPVDPEGVF